MPFASKKQARFLAMKKPEIFKRFVKDSGGKVVVKPSFKKKHKKEV